MRTFDACLPTLHWHVFRYFLPDCTFFISTVKDQDSHKAELLAKKYPDNKVFIEAFDEQPKLDTGLPPWELHNPPRFYGHEPHAISVSPQAVLAQLWQLEQGYRLYLKNTEEKDLADVVIRCRPDLWFHSLEMYSTNEYGTEIPLPWKNIHWRGDTCLTPCWGQFGGINDRFAIMGRDAAFAYFYTFSKLKELFTAGCPLHPESLVKAALELAGCVVDPSLKVFFSTLRPDGQMRRPEIWIEDILHAILR